LEYNNGVNRSTNSVEKLSKSIGNYFDENGVLSYDRFTRDLRQVYNQARINTRKDK